MKHKLLALAMPLLATPLFTGCIAGDGQPPEAYAGENASAEIGQTVVLGAPESGEILLYEWEQISPANAVTFVDGYGAKNPQPQVYIDDSFAGQDIRFRLTVTDLERLSSTDEITISVPGCEEKEGVIFGDCVQRPWIGPITYDENEQVLSLYGQDPKLHSQWQTIASEFDPSDKILDIQLSDTDRFADVAFHLAPSEFLTGNLFDELETIDLSEYIGGTLTFDIRVLNAPFSNIGTLVTLQCGWPCRSPFLSVNQYAATPLGEWVTVTIPVNDFLLDHGDSSSPMLDITVVDKIVITPPFFMQEQRDYHYQLNNIQFNKPKVTCSKLKTDIFVDGCLNTRYWFGLTAYDLALDEVVFEGDRPDSHANWGLLIDEETGEKAVEIAYGDADTFAAVGLKTRNSSGELAPRDFSDFETSDGFLVFDLKVTNQSLNQFGVFITLECGWPCRSPYTQVNQYANVVEGEWVSVRIPIAHFLADNGVPEEPNLDLRFLDTIVIGGVWSGDEQKNFSFRIKNLRFDIDFPVLNR